IDRHGASAQTRRTLRTNQAILLGRERVGSSSMNGQIQTGPADLAAKIARLVEERGWNQEDFARIAGLNRQTVRQILLQNGDRRLRNATISACAKALGLSVSELRSLPLERLLPRMSSPRPTEESATLQRLYEQATQAELLAWMERNPKPAAQLLDEEIDGLPCF